MADPSDEELTLLLDLQASDHRLRKLEHQLECLPAQQVLDDAVAEVARVEATVETLRAELERSTAEQRTLEREVDTLAARRDGERVRLYDGSVTNQREMSSVEAEIESTERRLEEHEEDLLTVLERVDDLEHRLASAEEQLAVARAAAIAAEHARDDGAKELLADLGEASATRDRQVGALPERLRDRYEQAAARGGGTGVGHLDGLTCSACRIELSMADVDELYRGPALTTCPQCRRLLVVRG